MKYRKFIEENFLIDDPRTGQLVEMKLRPIQNVYYDTLVKEYNIESRGLTVPIREDILKARREGFCLDPMTKILTSDLTWVLLRDITVGQKIISVDESTIGRGNSRTMKTAFVQEKRSILEDAFRIKLDNGEEVIATLKHRFLYRTANNTARWQIVKKMQIGGKIRYITRTWGDMSLEDSWFGGLLDGEGSLRAKKSGGAEVTVCQTDGAVWKRLLNYAKNTGFSFREEWDNHKTKMDGYTRKPLGRLVFNRMNEIFELLGKTQPSRFKGREWWEGKSMPGKRSGEAWATILSIEPVGRREMIDLQTSTKTFIANGLVSHNSSLVLALFAADDILNESPTETNVLSYKDDATRVFRKRYRTYLLSYCARKKGHTVKEIQDNPGILEQYAKHFLEVDSDEFVLKHNHAHFFCGTANARTGGRGGVVQKLLFSELAFYPDKKELRAREIVEGTMRQVDVNSGWVFKESTANGENTYHAKAYHDAEAGQSRFKARFYGWRESYTEAEFELIKSEFSDKRMIPQEYPETANEAFLSSGDRFFDPTISSNLLVSEPKVEGNWRYFAEYSPGHRYALGADISEGVGRHNSTIAIIDYDHKINVNNHMITKPKVVAVYANNKIAPDLFAHEIKAGGLRYGTCVACPERNNHGFATLTVLKDIYYNIYRDEQEKLGWQTNMATKPKMLHELRTAVHEGLIEVSDASLKTEIVSYPAQDLNEMNVDEEDETGGHYDRVVALALAWAMRNRAMPSQTYEHKDEEGYKREEKVYDRFALFNELE